MNLCAIEDAATTWRMANPEHMCDGVVLVWREAAYGWKNELRDPQHERPGALAVDVRGRVWLAIGGNDQDGAQEWESIERPCIEGAGGGLAYPLAP